MFIINFLNEHLNMLFVEMYFNNYQLSQSKLNIYSKNGICSVIEPMQLNWLLIYDPVGIH